MLRLLIIAISCLYIAMPALADEPAGCDKFKWSIDLERAALSANLQDAASGTALSVGPQASANLLLKPLTEAGLPKEPERQPKSDTYAGYLKLSAIKAGSYSVGLSAGAWVDVIQDGQFTKPSGFSGATACEGIRKTMRFNLASGDAVLQVSNISTDSIKIAILLLSATP